MVPDVNSVPVRHIISLVASGIVISFNYHKRFERFIHLGHPKFIRVIRENAYEFLID